MLFPPDLLMHLTISDEADVVHKVSGAEYAQTMMVEYADDPDIAIQYVTKYGIEKSLLSPKDEKLPYLKDIVHIL